jgi:hypothetical protein
VDDEFPNCRGGGDTGDYVELREHMEDPAGHKNPIREGHLRSVATCVELELLQEAEEHPVPQTVTYRCNRLGEVPSKNSPDKIGDTVAVEVETSEVSNNSGVNGLEKIVELTQVLVDANPYHGANDIKELRQLGLERDGADSEEGLAVLISLGYWHSEVGS